MLTVVRKHSPGGKPHNQSTHGRRTSGPPTMVWDDMVKTKAETGEYPSDQYLKAMEPFINKEFIHGTGDYWDEPSAQGTPPKTNSADDFGLLAAAVDNQIPNSNLGGTFKQPVIADINPAGELTMGFRDVPNTLGHRYSQAWLDVDTQGGGAQAALMLAAKRAGDFETKGMKSFTPEGWVNPDTARQYLTAAQNHTRTSLVQQGFDLNQKVTLFRGMSPSAKDVLPTTVKEGARFKLASTPLSAWSADPVSARSYAALRGVVVSTEVRLGDIIGYHGSGMGARYLSEFVVPSSAIDSMKVAYWGR